MKKYKIYMGWDSREPLAYDVARHSILARAANRDATQVIPLELHTLTERGLINRPYKMKGNQMYCPISKAPMGSEFSITRFLIPKLTKGWALFVDPDIILQDDIAKIFDLRDESKAVMVVKHNYTPKETVHMVDQVQTKYHRKNWASVILWNCDHPAHARLTANEINKWPGRALHAFEWLNDDEIGSLPVEWNYLVNVSEPLPSGAPKLLHFTLGGPWLAGWQPAPGDHVWQNEHISLHGHAYKTPEKTAQLTLKNTLSTWTKKIITRIIKKQ